jgi:hypothetical protein
MNMKHYFPAVMAVCAGLFLIGGSSRPEFMFRIHLEAGKGENPKQVITLNMGRELGVNPVRQFAEISENDLQSIVMRPDGGAFITFNPGGRTRLEALTTSNKGRLMCVFLNARFIYAAEIDMELKGGRLFLPSGVTEEDVALFQSYIENRKKY